LLLFIPAFSLPTHAQPYQAKLFGNAGTSVGQTCLVLPDQGVAALGFTNSQGGHNDDMLLIRLDARLRVLWAKAYGGLRMDRGRGILPNGQSGFLLLGLTKSFGAGGDEILIVNVDSAGNLLWGRAYGGSGDDVPYSIHPVRGGGFLVSGTTKSFGSRGWAAFLLRIDAAGDVLWMQLYDNWSTDAAADFEQTSDDGFIAAGWAYAIGAGMHDVFVFKTDVSGNLLWGRLFGGPGDDGGHTVHELRNGDYIVNGNTHSFGHGGVDTYFLCLTTSGTLRWAKAVGMERDDSFARSFRDSDSSIVVAGWLTDPEDNKKEIWLSRISGSGNLLFSGRIRSTNSAQASALVNRKQNDYVFVGESHAGTDVSSRFLVGSITIPVHRTKLPWIYEPQPINTSTQDIAIATTSRRINVIPTPVVTIMTRNISLVEADDDGRLESLRTDWEPGSQIDKSRGRWQIVDADSEKSILARIAEIAALREKLQRQIPCDFGPVAVELERTEAILRIGDFEHSLESLWKAESLLASAPCGAVTIEELTALGSYYDRKSVELSASVVQREPSASGDGYFLTLTDNTGQIGAFYSGSMRDIMVNDQVLIEGSYSYDEAALTVRTITKQDSPEATGLLAAAFAVFITAAILAYRLIRRRSRHQDTKEKA